MFRLTGLLGDTRNRPPSPAWHRNQRRLRARARVAVRSGWASKDQTLLLQTPQLHVTQSDDMVRRCWIFILVCWVPFLEVGRWHSLPLQDQERCEESPERWKPVGLKCCAGACESGGLAHNQTVAADESVVGGCAGRRSSCANAHRGSEDRA